MKEYIVKGIYDDDYGCEESPEDKETTVRVILTDEEGKEEEIKESDSLLYKRNIDEGDRVIIDPKKGIIKI